MKATEKELKANMTDRCHHVKPYYCEEHDTYYCGKCLKDMGQAYYIAARERDRLKTLGEQLAEAIHRERESDYDVEDPQFSEKAHASYDAVNSALAAWDAEMGCEATKEKE